MARPTAAPMSSWIRSRLADLVRGEPRLTGHVRLLAAPAYRRFLQMEGWMRRSIPVLIVGFISILAITRSVSLLDQRQIIESVARYQVALTATAVAGGLSSVERRLPTETPAEALRDVMQDTLPLRDLPAGRVILVTDQAGTVVTTAPSSPDWEKRPLTALLGPSQDQMAFGQSVGPTELTLANGAMAIVSVALLDGKAGAVVVMQPHDSILQEWRMDVRNSITLFVATAAILLVLTYAYFAQITRASESDALYADTTARAETAFKRGRCGLWDWDLARGRIFWAGAIFEMLGLDPDDGILGFGELCTLAHPDDIDLPTLTNQLISGELSTFDQAFRMRRADGEWLWFRVRAEVVERLDTGSRHLIGTAADVTEQKHLADQSITADLRLRDAIETISEAFVLWDADNRLVMCNSKYQQLHNLSDRDMRAGTPYAEVMKAARLPTIRTPEALDGELEDRLREAGACTYEAEIEDGRWLQINERRTKDGGFVSVGTDITQLKRHEERLLDSERRLIGTIADLRQSRQKLETQAQQLVEMAEKYSEEKIRAEEANKIKSDFLANISHELRTPLNAIIGFSDLLSHGMVGPEKYREYGEDIHHSGTFLLNVINDILDMSKIEAGRLELFPAEVDLGDILTEATRILAFPSEEKRLTMAFDPDLQIPLQGDRRAIKQILLNLLSNAVKFTPDGGTVTVRASATPERVAVEIADTGIGIPKALVQKLGKPFVQVANQFTKTHRGSGLGLAIARSLIEMHGGVMDIQSVEGAGTTVRFDLPRQMQQRPVTHG